MVGLDKDLIKKYGITKKAWSIQRTRSKKGTKRTFTRAKRTKKVKTRGEVMARRRRTATRTRRRSNGSGGGVIKKLTSKKALTYIVGASLFGHMIPVGIEPRMKTAIAGFLATGPVGAVGGYFADPIIKNTLGGVSGMGVSNGSTKSLFQY